MGKITLTKKETAIKEVEVELLTETTYWYDGVDYVVAVVPCPYDFGATMKEYGWSDKGQYIKYIVTSTESKSIHVFQELEALLDRTTFNGDIDLQTCSPQEVTKKLFYEMYLANDDEDMEFEEITGSGYHRLVEVLFEDIQPINNWT